MNNIKAEYSIANRIVNLLDKLKPSARARVLAIVGDHKFDDEKEQEKAVFLTDTQIL